MGKIHRTLFIGLQIFVNPHYIPIGSALNRYRISQLPMSHGFPFVFGKYVKILKKSQEWLYEDWKYYIFSFTDPFGSDFHHIDVSPRISFNKQNTRKHKEIVIDGSKTLWNIICSSIRSGYSGLHICMYIALLLCVAPMRFCDATRHNRMSHEHQTVVSTSVEIC